MKLKIVSLVSFMGIVCATPVEVLQRDSCHANNCLRAIRGTESIGLAFCSGEFDIRPIISTSSEPFYTITAGETTVYPDTTTETQTITTGTAETSITQPPNKERRGTPSRERREEIPEKAISNIRQKCSNSERITSACSCFLSGRPTSTIVYTEYIDVTTTVPTVTETLTISTTTFVEAQVTFLPLIKNPGFDDPVEPFRDWTIFGNTTGCDACTYEASPNEGSVTSPNSLKINWIGASGVFWIRQTIPLEVGKTYRFKFQYKVDSPSRDEAFITLTIAGTPKAVLGATNQWQWAESWDARVGEFDTPEIEVTCFLARSPPEATEVFYFDSFRVWEIGPV